jgi:hypothetical protein
MTSTGGGKLPITVIPFGSTPDNLEGLFFVSFKETVIVNLMFPQPLRVNLIWCQRLMRQAVTMLIRKLINGWVLKHAELDIGYFKSTD